MLLNWKLLKLHPAFDYNIKLIYLNIVLNIVAVRIEHGELKLPMYNYPITGKDYHKICRKDFKRFKLNSNKHQFDLAFNVKSNRVEFMILQIPS